MKSFLNRDRSWAYGPVLLMAVLMIAVGVWGRLYQLGFPPDRIWDEIYFPVMARKYLEGVYFFDLHPPLGKFIIAISIALFGDTPVGWRLMPALFGVAMIPLGAVLGWYYFRERVGALLLAAFIAGETFLVAYSRTGIMDGILLVFMLATLLAALLAERRGHVLWVAVLLGLSIGTKWAVLTVALPVGYILWRKGLFRPFLASLWISAVIYVVIVYVGQLVNVSANPWEAWQSVWTWHIEAAEKVTAAIFNLWGSPWWSWPIMLRPIRLYMGATAEGQVQVISAIGNPLLWYGSTLAVVAGLFEVARRLIARKPIVDDPLVPILLGYVFLLLPWVPGTR
ncbi:MAG: phospholipid carrier-dependent glycosyltransferase, partial [Actinobacteria bacterium]|nr:phospholipid carrier-dependent glycosyltransferase [Actinomycetota bacterium]